MEWLVIFAVSFLSGYLSGTIGFASGVLPAAILSLVLPADIAVPLLAPIVLSGAAAALTSHWKEWETHHILLVIPPLLLGTWSGTQFLSAASESLVSYAIAFFVIMVAIQELSGQFSGRSDESFRLQKVIARPVGRAASRFDKRHRVSRSACGRSGNFSLFN